MSSSLENSPAIRTGEALEDASYSRGAVFMNLDMGQVQRLVLELFVAERTAHHPGLVQAFVVLELDPVAELLPTLGAGVAALVVLDSLVPGHVVVLAEGLVADRAFERALLGVHPHVSGQFVGPSE